MPAGDQTFSAMQGFFEGGRGKYENSSRAIVARADYILRIPEEILVFTIHSESNGQSIITIIINMLKSNEKQNDKKSLNRAKRTRSR